MPSGSLLATAKLAAVAAVATVSLALAAWLVSPWAGAAVGLGVSVFVAVFVAGRAAGRLEEKLDELALDVSQTEALVSLAARLPTRRPLPPMRSYAIAPDCALLLATLIADERPRLVVETGSGVSTLVIAYALEQLGGGRVVALERDPAHAARTRAELERHGLTAWATVVDAPLEPIEIAGQRTMWHAVSALDGLEDIDLVFDDGPPKCVGPMLRAASLPVFSRRLSARGLFVLNKIGDEETQALARWQVLHPEFSQEYLETKKGNVLIRRA